MDTNADIGYQVNLEPMSSYFIFTKGDGWYCTTFDNQEHGPFATYRDAEAKVKTALAIQRLSQVA